MMKRFFSKKSARIGAVVATVATLIVAVVAWSLMQPKEEEEYFLELRTEKEIVELSSNDGIEARQHALLGNIIVAYYGNDDEKVWFRATEKTGVIEGDANSFNFNTEDGFSFVIKVDGTTVNVVVTKEAATSAISFKIKEVALVGGSGNAPATDGPAIMVGGGLSKEEKDAIRQEAASDDNAVDVDNSGNVVGIQQPENIWTADKVEEKTDVIVKDDKGDYHLVETRPESNPSSPAQKQENPVKEQPKEEQKPHEVPAQEPAQPAEEEKAEEITQKTNSYERVSVMISRGNVVSAFSQNGGTGKLNLIVDSTDGNTYVCHDKAGNTYVATIMNNTLAFNGEVYYL